LLRNANASKSAKWLFPIRLDAALCELAKRGATIRRRRTLVISATGPTKRCILKVAFNRLLRDLKT